MFPLKVITIACESVTRAQVLAELDNLSAVLEVEIASARDALQKLPASLEEKRLLVFQMRHADEVQLLRQLTGTLIGWPIVVLADETKEAGLMLKCMRAGAAQFVPLPVQSDDFRDALGCISVQFGHAPNDPGVIAVTGVSGGCGATTLAVNLAYEAAVHKRRCIVAELSLRMSMLSAHLDLKSSFSTFDLFATNKPIDLYLVKKVLTRFDEYLDVLPGPDSFMGSVQCSIDAVLQTINYLRRLAGLVILDLPCTYDEVYFQTLAAVDQVVLVGDQRVPSVRALSLMNDAFERDAGLDAQRLTKQLVINRYDPNLKGLGLDLLREVLQAPQLRSVAADQEGLLAALDKGQPLRKVAPKSPALADIAKLAQVLWQDDPGDVPAAKPKGLTRLLRTLGM
jgi:pilus assembly protein CpaE